MGYNKSRFSVLRSKPQLDILVSSPKTVFFPTSDPRKLARKLNEALAAAEVHDEFKHYTRIKDQFKFRAGSGELIAERLDETSPVASPPEHSPKPASPIKETFPNITDLVGVMVVASKEPADELFFPDANLTLEEKRKLLTWTTEALKLKFIDHDGAGLTLTKLDVPDEILWREE